MLYNVGKKEKGGGIHETRGGIGSPGAGAACRVRPGRERSQPSGTHSARKRGAVPGRRGSFHGARERPLHYGHPHRRREKRPGVWGLRQAAVPGGRGLLQRRHLGGAAAGVVQQHRPRGDGGNRQHPVAAGERRGNGVLRHLHRRGKSRRPGEGGHRAVLLQGGAG